ncbi:MAG TPA: hypothetical protein VK801_11035 [Caulobacteraceae bacterium]|nr:hypothetical protein [Caulobacteraceae bacterium]
MGITHQAQQVIPPLVEALQLVHDNSSQIWTPQGPASKAAVETRFRLS